MSSEPEVPRTFILRVWREPDADGGGEWRGELKHVPGGQSTYFRSWDALPALMRRLVEGEEGEPR